MTPEVGKQYKLLKEYCGFQPDLLLTYIKLDINSSLEFESESYDKLWFDLDDPEEYLEEVSQNETVSNKTYSVGDIYESWWDLPTCYRLPKEGDLIVRIGRSSAYKYGEIRKVLHDEMPVRSYWAFLPQDSNSLVEKKVLSFDDLVVGEVYIEIRGQYEFVFCHSGTHNVENFRLSDEVKLTWVGEDRDFRKATDEEILKYQELIGRETHKELSENDDLEGELNMRESQVESLQQELDEKKVEITILSNKINELHNQARESQRKHNIIVVERDFLKSDKLKLHLKNKSLYDTVHELVLDNSELAAKIDNRLTNKILKGVFGC